jgi:hypothetical protein
LPSQERVYQNPSPEDKKLQGLCFSAAERRSTLPVWRPCYLKGTESSEHQRERRKACSFQKQKRASSEAFDVWWAKEDLNL